LQSSDQEQEKQFAAFEVRTDLRLSQLEALTAEHKDTRKRMMVKGLKAVRKGIVDLDTGNSKFILAPQMQTEIARLQVCSRT